MSTSGLPAISNHRSHLEVILDTVKDRIELQVIFYLKMTKNNSNLTKV